jgi:hypothetical protein
MFSTGADAPRSCVGVRMFAGEKTIFAMHERTPTKSGGRKPAVGVATHWQRKANSLRITSVVIRSGGRKPAVGLVT